MMNRDPIIEEIRQIREAHAARHGYDSEAIYNDLRELERLVERRIVYLPSRPPDRAAQGRSARGTKP